MDRPSANAVVPKAWSRAAAAARVGFAATGPTATAVLDISREPADGDPAHTGHSVLRSRPIES